MIQKLALLASLLICFFYNAYALRITPLMVQIQCKHESHGDPNAISDKGAMGLCQFMPKTWDELASKYKDLNNPFDPDQSLKAAERYMNYLWDQWKVIKDPKERYCFTLASYNSGISNVKRAYRSSLYSKKSKIVLGKLDKIIGEENARTVREYVAKIVGEVSDLYDL